MQQGKEILLVEDDDVDALTVRRALKEIHVTNPMRRVTNGEEALEYLRGTTSLPGIILLDINMPRMNGIEFLRIVKQEEPIRRIPVIVLTTSREDQDRLASFDLQAAGYMLKPVDYLQFVDVMRAIQAYWTASEVPE